MSEIFNYACNLPQFVVAAFALYVKVVLRC